MLLTALTVSPILGGSKVKASNEGGQTIKSQTQVQEYINKNNLKTVTGLENQSTIPVKLQAPKLVRTITNAKEIEKYCTKKGLPTVNEDGKKVKSIDIMQADAEDTEITTQPKSEVKPRMFGDVIEKQYPMNFTGSNCCAKAKGPYGGTITLSNSYSEQATLSSNISVSAGDVSASVGFSVSSTYTINPSYSYTPTSGENGATIYAYPIYKGWAFKVMRLGIAQVGAGVAYRPIGVSYTLEKW
jgi:hypothetical protein